MTRVVRHGSNWSGYGPREDPLLHAVTTRCAEAGGCARRTASQVQYGHESDKDLLLVARLCSALQQHDDLWQA